MIFNYLITFVTGILAFIVNLLPTANPAIVSLITNTTSAFRTSLASINWFFPVDTALTFFSAMFLIQSSIFLFKLIKYIAGVLSGGVLK